MWKHEETDLGKLKAFSVMSQLANGRVGIGIHTQVVLISEPKQSAFLTAEFFGSGPFLGFSAIHKWVPFANDPIPYSTCPSVIVIL